MDLFIKSWAMWMPPSNDENENSANSQPQLNQIPAMTRRRLSKLTKLAFDVALQTAPLQEHSSLPTVFASRHGDLHKTLQLLQQLAQNEALSPSQFALSVHNAISGQFSIYSQNQADSNAIAAGSDSLHYAILDAAVRLQVEPDLQQILVVYADEPTPAPYQTHCQDPSMPVAMALLLHKNEGEKIRFNMQESDASLAEENQVFKLHQFLSTKENNLNIQGNNRVWQWRKAV